MESTAEVSDISAFPQENNYDLIEGLPNEVLIAILIVIFSMAYILRHVINYFGFADIFNNRMAIHPEALAAVDATRRQFFGSSRAEPAQSGRSQDSTCPICLRQPIRLPIETNCGHAFCGRCFATFCAYDTDSIHPVRCPVCRQRVTLLLPGFALEEARSLSPEDRSAVLEPLKQYNRRFSGEPRSWLELIQDLPTLMRHLLGAVFSESGLALVLRLRVLLIFFLAAFYVLLPIDLLPEALLGAFGLLDDLFIFFLLAVYVTMLYRTHVASNPQFLGPGIEGPDGQ